MSKRDEGIPGGRVRDDAMHNFDPDLSSQIITEEDRAQIEACLQQLRTDTGAGYSMVLDRAGQIIAWESSAERREMVYLGALLAATYASTREIARNVQEAAQGTEQVSGNIAQVSAGVSESRAAASQLLAASGQLAENAETLKGVVDRFLAEIRAA